MVQINQNKHVYAAYCNMAQHNFFMTFEYICKCLGMGKDSNDFNPFNTILDNLKSKKTHTDKKDKICTLLRRHFPFLAPMTDTVISTGKATNEVDALCFILPKVNEVLNFYRNYTTHYDSDEENEFFNLNLNERSLVSCIKDLHKAALRTVQQRFNYSEHEMSFIKNNKMGRENSQYSLYKKELISNKDDKPSNVFSLRGLLCFISLFLEKKYIGEMLAKTKAFYTYGDLKTTKRRSIIFESLAVYRIKLPRMRYESVQNSTALALDMVNELQRCPLELFDLLCPNDQKLFRSEEKSDDDLNTTLMVRHSDRFPQLALQFIDQQEIFRDIRFQVKLGTYRFAFYDKKCIDGQIAEGQSHVRSLQKELHGFGRLNEIEKQRVETWAPLIRDFEDVQADTPDSEPYITDHHASYLINNNHIGLYWKAGPNDPRPGLPQLIDSPQAKDLRERKKNGEQIVSLTPPKCFMSTHELPALIFYHLLFNAVDDNAKKSLALPGEEKIIKNFATGFKKFIDKVITGEINGNNARNEAAALGIDYDRHLPKKLQNYLSGASYDENKAISKLQSRLEEHIVATEKRLERFMRDLEQVADERNKRGKSHFVEIKPGKLGDWLAHDIIAMQPAPSAGNKLTGLNFQILQSALSMFTSLEQIKRILVSAHLIMHDDAHPFLMEVINSAPSSTAAFYKKYLEVKVKWLRSLPLDNLKNLPFLTRGKNKWARRDNDFHERLLQAYLELPVELPRGLFEPHIKKILEYKYDKNFIQGDKRDDANVSFLIAKHFKRLYQDDSQEFYTQPQDNYKRYYGFFKLLQHRTNDKDDYGKTISEIDNILRNDASLQMLSETAGLSCDDNKIIGEGIEEVNKKLAKSLAKNPALDKQQRIKDIINTSQKLRKLTASQQNKLMTALLNGNSKPTGLVSMHLKKVVSNADKEKEIQILSRALHCMKSTERLIRRYKVQDIIIFLMARHILFNKNENMLDNSFAHFKLKNIKPIRRQEGISALEISVPFSITLHIKGSNIPVKISQQAIKLKNYGDFLRFLFDSRIETLIPYLVDDENAVSLDIDRNDLEQEFEKYDRVRFDVFENAHRIERLILERHKELHDKMSPHYYYDDKGENKAKRTSFSQLLAYAKLFSEKEESEAINIRNSFAHNAYIGEGFEKVNVPTTTVGEIAPSISEVMGQKIKLIGKNK
ncbi:MAG: type VI-B CRISPR-associated RNA-guided ribonuclease Cas13b [Muribaculaceae bacterium]|nr:type VI-B CRISPR-associated RNA-guided ribonuclease Cas13b [Muribaculaceae bacterium]